jgi:serine/threonine protein kinase
LRRDVAIKVSAAKFSQRFEREARVIAGLNHPHICSLCDVGPDFLVMEYVVGAPLRGPLALAQALRYVSQICDALDAAHRNGIVHRDLKPGNILVGGNGVKVLDFGLAKIEPTPLDRRRDREPDARIRLRVGLAGRALHGRCGAGKPGCAMDSRCGDAGVAAVAWH